MELEDRLPQNDSSEGSETERTSTKVIIKVKGANGTDGSVQTIAFIALYAAMLTTSIREDASSSAPPSG